MQTDTWIEKTEWGDGPWQHEPDRAEWRDKATGLPCLALRNPNFGNWCGYVAVPPTHPWHGLSYHDVDVEVHGGLTFAESCMEDERPLRERVCHVPRAGESDDVWWLGFDCHHFMDLGPGFAARERALFGLPEEPPTMFRGPVYRSLAYVQIVCERLAAQVAAARGDAAHPEG